MYKSNIIDTSNYNILVTKLVQYLREATPTVRLQSESQRMFDNYFADLKENPEIINSNRLNESLYLIYKAWGKMYLCSSISPAMMTDIQDYFTTILKDYVNITKVIENPYEQLKALIITKLRENSGVPFKVNDIVELICKEHSDIASILDTAKKRQLGHNRHLVNVVEVLKEEPNIHVYKEKPMTLVYNTSKSTTTAATTSSEENRGDN